MTRAILPLLDFIPKVTPQFHRPNHLTAFCDLFTRMHAGEQIAACVSVPPRHEKTDTAAHAIAWLLKQNPRMRIAYVTYGEALAQKKSRRIRAIAQRARVPLDPHASSASDWRTGHDEGGLWGTSPGAAIVGEGFDLICIDDPTKDRVAAESSLSRERLHEWFSDTLYPRLEPGGSVIVIGHRWHPDDLIGRLVGEGFEEINFPALDDLGLALWPPRFNEAQLTTIRERIGPYAWDSLYMGRPRSRGGAVFNDVHHYDQVPEGCRYVIGVDLAYTAKTRADYSCGVVCAIDPAGVFYVVHVERRQCIAPDFAHVLAGLRQTWGNPPMASYVSGVERGSLDFMARAGVPVTPLHAGADKFVRAQGTAAAWGCGRIRVPREARWLNPFVEEVCGFTGSDAHDDQVDALVSAFDSKAGSVGAATMIDALRGFVARGGAQGLALRLGLNDHEYLRRFSR